MKKTPVALFAVLMALAGPVQAFVAQSPQKAFSFQNVARTTATVPQEDSKQPTSDAAFVPVPSGQSVDFEAIAEKILPEQPAPVLTLSLQTKDLRNVKIPLNYILKLELPEADGTSWHIDTNEEIIKPVSSQKQNDIRIFEFQSVAPGTTKLYLDNQTDDRRCLQSRILRIRVTP